MLFQWRYKTLRLLPRDYCQTKENLYKFSKFNQTLHENHETRWWKYIADALIEVQLIRNDGCVRLGDNSQGFPIGGLEGLTNDDFST